MNGKMMIVATLTAAVAVGQTYSGVAASSYYLPIIYGADPVLTAGGTIRILVKNSDPGPVTDAFFANVRATHPSTSAVVWTGTGGMFTLAGGAEAEFHWDGADAAGVPLPPGLYHLSAFVAGSFWATFGATQIASGPAPESAADYFPRPWAYASGKAQFHSPLDAGMPYVFAMAFGSGSGIPTCGGLVPLDDDPLLAFILGPQNVLVTPLTGTLDANGCTPLGGAPSITIPNDPAIAGWVIYGAFVVLDYAAPCLVRRVGPPMPLDL